MEETLIAKDFLKKYLAENTECKFDEVMVEFAKYYCEREKLKFAMEQLNRAKDLDIITVFNQLKQQLKELEK